jgi:hypothetical protein
MVNLSKKALAVVIVIVFALTLTAVLIAVDFQGWGTSLAGVGGPFAANIYNLFNGVPVWISSGGWPTLGVGILIFIVALPLLAAYAVWHYDVPYKITGAVAPSPASTFTNTMQREPTPPERAPTSSANNAEKGA